MGQILGIIILVVMGAGLVYLFVGGLPTIKVVLEQFVNMFKG